MMPNGWKLVEAQDVCKSISVGVVIKPTQYYVEEADGVKAFRSANVREGFINDNDWVYFSHEGHSANKKSQLKAGDVLIVRTGYPGTACVVTPEFEGSNAIDIVIARPDVEQVVPEYLCAYTNSHIGKSQVLDLQGGMAQKHLNVGAYQVLKIKLPPLPEQTKIAQILSTWDKAITTTEQLLANSQQQKKALMQQVLTGKKRLLDRNGVRFSGEWKTTEIGEFLQESRIPSKTNDPSKRLTVRLNLKGIEPREFRGTEAVESTAHFVRSAGQFIYGKQNIHKGAFGIIPEDLDAYETSQDLPAFDFTGACDPIWFYHYMTQEHFFASLEDKMSGTGSKRLNPKTFFKIKIASPSIEEQQKIAAVISTADQEISTLQQKLEALKQEKKALMQQLLTGKRRVIN